MPRYLLFAVLAVAAIIATAAFYLRQPEPAVAGGAAATLGAGRGHGGGQGLSTAAMKAATPAAGLAVPSALRDIMQLSAGLDRRQKMERLAFEAAAKDPELALQQLALVKGADRAAYLRGLFEHFATLPPVDALKWAKRLDKGADRDVALQALMGTWRAGDAPDPASEARMMGRYGLAGGLGFRFLNGDYKDPEMAALWAQEVATGGARLDLLGEAGAQLAKTDAAKALALGDTLTGQDHAQFLRRVAAGWAEASPEAAWKWAGDLADAGERATVQSGLVRDLARTDGPAAARRLAELPAGQERDRAFSTVGFSWGARDPEAALAWAQGLSDPAQQKSALGIVQRAASTALGFNAPVGADGYPTVASVAQDRRGGDSVALKPNDRIVAVLDSKGNAVDARGLSMQQLIEQARNSENSKLSVQVLSATDNGPRTVQLSASQRGGYGGPGFGGYGGRGPRN